MEAPPSNSPYRASRRADRAYANESRRPPQTFPTRACRRWGHARGSAGDLGAVAARDAPRAGAGAGVSRGWVRSGLGGRRAGGADAARARWLDARLPARIIAVPEEDSGFVILVNREGAAPFMNAIERRLSGCCRTSPRGWDIRAKYRPGVRGKCQWTHGRADVRTCGMDPAAHRAAAAFEVCPLTTRTLSGEPLSTLCSCVPAPRPGPRSPPGLSP
jgi:hypothetical protein